MIFYDGCPSNFFMSIPVNLEKTVCFSEVRAGGALQRVTFFCLAKKKVTKENATQ